MLLLCNGLQIKLGPGPGWKGLISMMFGTWVFYAGDIQIGTLFTPIADGMILTGLTAADQMNVFFFHPAAPDVFGSIDGMLDNLESLRGIFVIVKFYSG